MYVYYDICACARAYMHTHMPTNICTKCIWTYLHGCAQAEVIRESKNGTFRVVFTEYGNEQDTRIEDLAVMDERGLVMLYVCVCMYVYMYIPASKILQ